MKKYLPAIIIFIAIIGVIALVIWNSDKNSPIKELAKLDVYSKEELSFLEKQGFLNDIDSKKTLKSPNLIEQNLNSSDESFEVLATKLDKNTYQLAFKLENKSNQEKEFYLIPISESSQTEFKEIKWVVKGGEVNWGNQGDWGYDIEKHKQELRPELVQAYDDIDNNGYTGKPIKLILEPNSILIAQSKWQINRDRASGSLEPVYLLVYGSAGGAKDDLDKDNKSFENLDKVKRAKEDHFKIEYDKWSEVELGDLETTDFEPTAKLKKWGDETYIKVSYPTAKKIKPEQENKKLKWKDDKVEVHFYPLEPREYEENGHQVKQLEKGGFEFEIILKEPPASNVITLDIETKGLAFHYQPELTQQEIDQGCFRPENVVGSYAVYHATKSAMHSSPEEAEKYKAGKAFHIYRPRIEDAEGKWVWGILKIENDTLSVEIEQDFLDNAVYPVSIDPDFGYDTIGGSGPTEVGETILFASGKGTPASSGTVTTLHIYGDTPNETDVRVGLYTDDSGSGPTTKVGTERESTEPENGTNRWMDFPTNALSVTGGTAYWPTADYESNLRINYDSLAGTNRYWNTDFTYGDPWPATFSQDSSSGAKYSMYCTYTPSTAVPSVGIKGSAIRIKGAKLKIK